MQLSGGRRDGESNTKANFIMMQFVKMTSPSLSSNLTSLENGNEVHV